MPETLAIGFWILIGIYALIGVGVALWLLTAGLHFDSNAAAAPVSVKLIWLPGLIALWPLLLRRASGFVPPEDRR